MHWHSINVEAVCSVAVVERGPLKGREQEWNISRKELNELVISSWLVCTLASLCNA